MVDVASIMPGMEVVGSDRQHVGRVDAIEGQRMKLSKADPLAGGEHHYLHVDVADVVADGRVVLNRTAAQARDEWGVKQVG